MKRISVIPLAVALMISITSQIPATELPVPPAGYSWVNCAKTKTHF